MSTCRHLLLLQNPARRGTCLCLLQQRQRTTVWFGRQPQGVILCLHQHLMRRLAPRRCCSVSSQQKQMTRLVLLQQACSSQPTGLLPLSCSRSHCLCCGRCSHLLQPVSSQHIPAVGWLVSAAGQQLAQGVTASSKWCPQLGASHLPQCQVWLAVELSTAGRQSVCHHSQGRWTLQLLARRRMRWRQPPLARLQLRA
jgi:hypothetical protein